MGVVERLRPGGWSGVPRRAATGVLRLLEVGGAGGAPASGVVLRGPDGALYVPVPLGGLLRTVSGEQGRVAG